MLTKINGWYSQIKQFPIINGALGLSVLYVLTTNKNANSDIRSQKMAKIKKEFP